MGHTLICGSKTFKSLPSKAHEGRRFCILTTNPDDGLDVDKYFHFPDIREMFEVIKDTDETIYVIGGESVYEQLIDHCDEAIITWVNKMYLEGDKKFPINKLFTNFEIMNDSSWEKSVSGLSFKKTHYIKSL
jgi:dihydrofolate reductase